MTPYILGIDPGVSGGAVILNPDGEVMAVLKFETEGAAAEWLGCRLGYVSVDGDVTPLHAYLEKVQAFPGQGRSSMFTFGANYGFWRGLLQAHRIPFETVLPTRWQAGLGIKKGKTEEKVAWKNRLKQKARELFPRTRVTLALADALLIAEYGRRTILGRGSAAAELSSKQ